MVKVSDNVHWRIPFAPITELGDTGPVCRPVTIGTLPDDALEIFSFYVEQAYYKVNTDLIEYKKLQVWCTLVHVCQRWRKLVFASPGYLRLRLLCTKTRPVKERLDIWPTLPIFVMGSGFGPISQHPSIEDDNIIAALEHRDRVCQITFLSHAAYIMDRYTTMMQESFLALTHLYLHSGPESPPILPDSFLGRSAPRLQSLTLYGIRYPALPNLLLTTKDLVTLRLGNIPPSGTFHPRHW